MSVKLLTLKQKNNNSGFVILYAVIITTVVLLVGVTLMNIMTKQLVLSSISRNAKVSYYAALAGRDCAEFWKKIQINGNNYFSLNNTSTPIKCFGDTFASNYQTVIGTTVVTTFDLELTVGTANACSKVRVVFDANACEANRLLISSEGYNDVCSAIGDLNPRLVRSIYKDKKAVCP